jgi:hypothetical protein
VAHSICLQTISSKLTLSLLLSLDFAFAFLFRHYSNGVKKINYGVVKKYFRDAAELKYFRRNSLFLAISVQSDDLWFFWSVKRTYKNLFTIFHPGKVDGKLPLVLNFFETLKSVRN